MALTDTTTREKPVKPIPRPRRLRALAPHLLALVLALALILGIPLRWNQLIGASGWQSTDDAYLRGDLTPLSAKVGGYVRRVVVSDYQPVHAGDLIVEIADEDYRAQAAQAEANVVAAEASIGNNDANQALQLATIKAADAGVAATRADLRRYQLESDRQKSLVQSNAGSRQMLEQADANLGRTVAQLEQAQAQAEAQRRQLDVLKAQAKQLEASLAASRAMLDLARLNVGYTKIVAPADGMVGERQVRPGQLVSVGSQVITVVPLPNVWVVANFKETQLTHVKPGQRANITVDAFPSVMLRGHIETIAPASGSQFALLPPDNASGNFTKVVQRLPVKIVLDEDNELRLRLRPGMSVTASIDATSSGAEEDRTHFAQDRR